MSSPLVAQQDAEILPNDPNDGVQQGVDRVEAAGSDNEELPPASISAHLDQLTQAMTLAVRLPVKRDGKITKNSSNIDFVRQTDELAKLILELEKLIKP